MTPFTPQQQDAFEAFGDAWAHLKQIEKAVAEGNGVSFLHHEAIGAMQAAALGVRDALTPPAPRVKSSPAEAFQQLRDLTPPDVAEAMLNDVLTAPAPASGEVEIINPRGRVAYRRPLTHPDVLEALQRPGYSVRKSEATP